VTEPTKPTKKKSPAKKTTSRPRRPKAPAALESFNPATGDVMRTIATTPPGDVQEIVAQARKVAPEWASISPEGRAHILKQVGHRIYDLMDEIIETVHTENGKPRLEALTHDIMPTLILLTYFTRMSPRHLRPEKVGRFVGPLLTGTSARVE
jgi:acyl-CoA reductase-like NAD-dependent aldehyde dehydrogenase